MEEKLVACYDTVELVEDEGEKQTLKQKIEAWLQTCERITDREELQNLEKVVDQFKKELAEEEEE